MLVDPASLDLAPIARELLDGDELLKLELPASQAEIATVPADRVADAVEQLVAGRRRLAERAGGRARVIAAGRAPVRRSARRAQPRRTLRRDPRRPRRRRPRPARVRAPGARRRGLRGRDAGRLQRAARVPARARRARGQRALLRGARHGLRVRAPADRDDAPAPGRPAADPLVGGVRGDAALDRGPEELVVRAASAPRVRHARDPRLRHPDDGRRGRRGRGLRARAGRLAARARGLGPARSPGGSARTAGAPPATVWTPSWRTSSPASDGRCASSCASASRC